MKRLHIHVGVDDLDKGINFYNAMFGEPPVKTKSDYAKWMLDDPRINFAISTRSGKKGLDHLGIQVDEVDELEVLRDRFKSSDLSVYNEGEAVCCYARSEKTWVEDPSGIAWETYKTMEDVQLFSDVETACCTPDSLKQTPSDDSSGKARDCCGQ